MILRPSMAQVVNPRPFKAEARFRSQVCPCEMKFMVGKVALELVYVRVFRSPYPHQYRSSNVPYSFIHISQTLCKLNNG